MCNGIKLFHYIGFKLKRKLYYSCSTFHNKTAVLHFIINRAGWLLTKWVLVVTITGNNKINVKD